MTIRQEEWCAMSIFEDVLVNAKSAANVVGKKAGQLVDVSKLRISAADLNNELSKRFETLGRVVYNAQKNGTDASEAMQENMAAIEDLYEQLDAINQQLTALRNKSLCKQCGAENPQDALYCNYCGARLTPPEEAAEAAPAPETVEEPAEEPVEEAGNSEEL